MPASYTLFKPSDIDGLKKPFEQFKLDVLMGFSAHNKFLSSRYLYDDRGSKLFEQIMDLEEYYPYDCELEVFNNSKSEIAEILSSQKFNLIELGAGDGRKTRILLDEFAEQDLSFQYVPVDISEYAVKDLTDTLQAEYPKMEIQGIVCEYFDAINWFKNQGENRNLILFLGSNIGNFNRLQAVTFLRTMWEALNDGDMMLIGFDLKKDIDVMLHAYNDSKGVTSQFNLNVLTRINKELGADFDLSKFQHFGTYSVVSGAMESHLISLEEQDVYIDALQKSFHFKAFEPVHMEYSFKYLRSDIEALAREAGFDIVQNFTDSKGYFVDSVWKVVKN